MARVPIDEQDVDDDERSLPSGIGIDLENNIASLQPSRLKRHGESYYLGPSSSGGATPPVGDSTLLGPVGEIQGTAGQNDPEGIGLKLSSPPTVPLVLYLGEWPLSAWAEKLRIVIGCATELADVDLFACATLAGGMVPTNPNLHLIEDDDGLVSWDSVITGDTAYKRVGTSSPSGTQDVKPVVLEIDLGAATRRDFGNHGDGDAVLSCRVYLCILSRQGAQASDVGQSSLGTIRESGRRIDSTTAITSWASNPGPLHRWIKLTVDETALRDSARAWSPLWRGVLQLRPVDVGSNPTNSNGSFVIHPPLGAGSPHIESDSFDMYDAGTIIIHSWTIQETAS